MLVFVLNKNGQAIMPCSSRKARLLLKENKAKIVGRVPFTIQLLFGSSGYVQETNLGVDTGAKYIGIAITMGNRVLIKGQITLRQDIKSLMLTRKMLRRTRRNRNTRYRETKFLNRVRRNGWLPPSIQSRISHTVNWVNKFYSLLPKCTLNIEIAKFDVQKIENPSISSKDYQQGTLYEYRNRIGYLIAREKGRCQLCKKEKDKNSGWRIHHIFGKDKDRPEHLALLHNNCHKELHEKGMEGMLRNKKARQFKECTFMNIVKTRLFSTFNEAKFTYGYITYQNRLNLGLNKTHYNDAIATTGAAIIEHSPNSVFLINQFRKKKRSLHEVTARKGVLKPNNMSIRNNKNIKTRRGFTLNDKVLVNNTPGFITGFSNSGCYIKDIFGKYLIQEGKTRKEVTYSLLHFKGHHNNWQYIPELKEKQFLLHYNQETVCPA